MVHAARNLPDGRTSDGYGIKVDERYLKLNPDPLGPKHDERELIGWFGDRFEWAEGLREVQPQAIVHSSVLKRLAAEAGVQRYYEIAPASQEAQRHLKLTASHTAPPRSEEPH